MSGRGCGCQSPSGWCFPKYLSKAASTAPSMTFGKLGKSAFMRVLLRAVRAAVLFLMSSDDGNCGGGGGWGCCATAVAVGEIAVGASTAYSPTPKNPAASPSPLITLTA